MVRSSVPTPMGMAFVVRILRYPIKTLSAEEVTRTTLTSGHGLPGDRRFALALADAPWHAEPDWMPREHLLNLSRFPRLARLEARLGPDSDRLTIRRRGRLVLSADLATPHGRSVVSAFFAAYLAGDLFGHPRLVEFREGFGDTPTPRLSLLGSGTLAELSRIGGHPVEAAEMRVNLLVADLPPRAELDWVGRPVRVGGAVLFITDAMERATLPELQRTTFGHDRLGVWAEVIEGGDVRLGDPVLAEKTKAGGQRPSGEPPDRRT